MSHSSEDTIFARASGAGKAGVAVYRLSGSLAHGIVNDLVGKRINFREAVYAEIKDPKDGAAIDRGLVILFEKPSSFTGEDVAEFHLHGSRAVEAALYETLSQAGARAAEADEFTLRALKNGKLDLAQAEALADLIDSETTRQRKQALGQLEGRLSAIAEGWRREILEVLAPLEADIDFPDEGDVPAAVASAAGPAISTLKKSLTTFLNQSIRTRIIREGVSIAVIGPPNAGKSSLVNALAGSDVAIVSDIAGTTRDIVEARLDLGGVVATVADTAGLRGMTDDAIEAEGMARARARAETADLRVAVLDPTSEYVSREVDPGSKGVGAPLNDPDRRDLTKANNAQDINDVDGVLELLKAGDFLIWSRADLSPKIPYGMAPDNVAALSLSAKTGLGVDAFVHALTLAVAGQREADSLGLTRVRHVNAVDEAIAALSRAEAHIETAPELAAEDARLAARALGQITGAVGVEDVLGEIFSSFCIGK